MDWFNTTIELWKQVPQEYYLAIFCISISLVLLALIFKEIFILFYIGIKTDKPRKDCIAIGLAIIWLLIVNAIDIYMVLSHKGFMHGWDEHIIKDSLYITYLVTLFALHSLLISSISITKIEGVKNVTSSNE